MIRLSGSCKITLRFRLRHRLLWVRHLRLPPSRSFCPCAPLALAAPRFCLPRPPSSPPLSLGLPLPTPPSPPESSPTDFLAAPTPPATPPRSAPSRTRVLRRILRVGSLQDLFHFGLQPLLRFPHLLITRRLVLAGIALQFAAIDRHMPQLHQPRLLTQLQRLAKQSRQRPQMPFPKLRQRAVVRMFVRRQVAKPNIFVRRRLYLARAVDPLAVAVQSPAPSSPAHTPPVPARLFPRTKHRSPQDPRPQPPPPRSAPNASPVANHAARGGATESGPDRRNEWHFPMAAS